MPPANTPLTVFGATMLELMARRGLRSWKEVCRQMEARGYHFGPSSLSSWAHGKSAANKAFPSAFAEVLELDEKERAKLADAFTYRQDQEFSRTWFEQYSTI